jgi:hypothetical protein
MEGGLLKEAGLLASLSVFSLAVAAGYFFNRGRGKAEKGEDADQLQRQETEISRELARLNDLQAVLAKKAEELDVYLPLA